MKTNLKIVFIDGGICIGDSKIDSFVDNIIDQLKTEDVTIEIDSELLLTAFRAVIFQNRIDINNVELYFGDNKSEITKDGYITDFYGKCDLYSKYLDVLIDWNKN
jgi:hypothetical protein